MINISDKNETLRIASASSTIYADPQSIELLKNNELPKKDVLAVSKAAAVMSVKKTPELIPYCHPLPIDSVDVEFDVLSDHIVVTTTVTAIWKTGVEMEALTAASVATLNIYDMLKAVDKNMTIAETKLLSKKGGKSSYKETLPKNFKAAVLVTSDGTFAGKRKDKSGKIIQEELNQFGIQNIEYSILPDEQEQIRNELLKYCEQGISLVITTGGTGLGPRDVTVEATQSVIEREMPAVSAAMYNYGQKRTPYAMLSRSLVGSRGKTIIVNLPGSSKGAVEGMNAIFPGLFHVYKMMVGGGH
ncbi:MAG: bifunctional molybdenum cofactor biosynthesis protein MoaC/MoaB [Deltaproteobacteria bacterium]|nr:bifunctional molybdenum cofactor biosynthesis protein MoaC/MoaB [Deltaproteobacteria bacterium]